MNKKFLAIILIAILPLVILFLFSFYFYFESAVKLGNSIDDYYTLVINQGESLPLIIKQLKKDKVISSELIFKIYLKLNKIDLNIQAGEYDVPAHVSMEELSKILQNGVFDRKITFIEGQRIEQYAVQSAELITKNETDKQKFINDFLSNPDAKEGYLFPDTYSYNTDTTVVGLIAWMKSRFNEIVTPVLKTSKLKLTDDEIIIIASLVEREGRNSMDRPIIAGVIINRLNIDMPLAVDATTQYQMDSDLLKTWGIGSFKFWTAPITQEYLESDSIFNTRKTLGLPPTAICNPSLESIKSVINYQKTDYLYYIHDKNGQAHYAKTLDEHNQNVAKYIGYN